MKRMVIIMMLTCGLIAAGCMSVQAPEGYAALSNLGRFDYAAVSTDGSMFTMRTEENSDPSNADLKYWAQVLKNQFTLGKGYHFKEEGKFTASRGEGKWMLFEKKHKGVDHLYILGVVVDWSTIYILESGGEKKVFEKDVEKVKKAFATLK